MAKFGLGRGLEDLEKEIGTVPEMSILTGAERIVVRKIPLDQIGANPDQPRKIFSDSELNDLAASIRERGVIQPILLRSVAGQPYMYEIVAGERRFRASKIAGLTEIPAIIKTISNENAMEIALIENVQRENLNPIEEANAYKNLMQKCGYELSDVVRLIGKSESYIRNSIRLTELPESVQKMVQDGDISASHARTIAVAENPEKLANEIKNKKLSVEETGILVRNSKRSIKSRTHTIATIDSVALKSMQDGLTKALGAPVKIVERRGGAGQIVITFKSRIELNELIKKLIQK